MISSALSHAVNVNIFVQLNFRTSSPMVICAWFVFFVHIPINSICSFMIMIFTHIKFPHI